MSEARVDPGSSVHRLQIVGELDAHGLRLLERRCAAELGRHGTLVLDFTGMTACPSAVFGMVSDTAAAARRTGSTLELVGFTEAVMAIAGARPTVRGR